MRPINNFGIIALITILVIFSDILISLIKNKSAEKKESFDLFNAYLRNYLEFKTNKFKKFLYLVFGLVWVCVIYTDLIWDKNLYEYRKLINPILEIKQSEHNIKKTFSSEVEPDFPDIKINNSTLAGLDKNKNGIRDDVDIWINRVSKSNNERMMLRQKARALQAFFNISEDTFFKSYSLDDRRYLSLKLQEEVEIATFCANFIYGEKYDAINSNDNKLFTLTYNNDRRNDFIIKIRKLSFSDLHRESFSIKKQDCKFQVE